MINLDFSLDKGFMIDLGGSSVNFITQMLRDGIVFLMLNTIYGPLAFITIAAFRAFGAFGAYLVFFIKFSA